VYHDLIVTKIWLESRLRQRYSKQKDVTQLKDDTCQHSSFMYNYKCYWWR